MSNMTGIPLPVTWKDKAVISSSTAEKLSPTMMEDTINGYPVFLPALTAGHGIVSPSHVG